MRSKDRYDDKDVRSGVGSSMGHTQRFPEQWHFSLGFSRRLQPSHSYSVSPLKPLTHRQLPVFGGAKERSHGSLHAQKHDVAPSELPRTHWQPERSTSRIVLQLQAKYDNEQCTDI